MEYHSLDGASVSLKLNSLGDLQRIIPLIAKLQGCLKWD